ncbi:hypothetical protein [Acidocella sp.]|jgi:hypothetical protein|uniref:hypothetical protein n=1 Tax=Acidocella sp. TaxID=50710 RepID=UPI002F40FCAD
MLRHVGGELKHAVVAGRGIGVAVSLPFARLLSYYVVSRKKESLPQHFRQFHHASDDRCEFRRRSVAWPFIWESVCSWS